MRSLNILLVVFILGAYCYDIRSQVKTLDLLNVYIDSQFDQYIEKYNKPYKNNREEYETRLQNFEDALTRIKEMKGTSPFANFGINKFSDLSQSEFKSKILNAPVSVIRKLW